MLTKHTIEEKEFLTEKVNKEKKEGEQDANPSKP
jgi:hypothetical protein